MRVKLSVPNQFSTDIRYNDQIRYKDNLIGTNPKPKVKRIIGEVKQHMYDGELISNQPNLFSVVIPLFFFDVIAL